MERTEVIKMFEEIGCEKCTMLKDDPDSIIPGLLDADDVVIDIDVYLTNGIKLTIFCQGTIDLTSENYAGFKDCLVYGYENIEKIEFGQLGGKAKKIWRN